MEHGVNSYDNGDLTSVKEMTYGELKEMAEKLEYVYQFCQTLEKLFNEFEKNPMAKMMMGKNMPKFDKD